MRINSVQIQNQNLQTNRKSQPKFEARIDRGGESLVHLAKAISTKYDKRFLNELIDLLSKNEELKKIRLFAGEQGGLEPRFRFAELGTIYHEEGFRLNYIEPFTKNISIHGNIDLEERITPAGLAKKIVVTLQKLNSKREQDLVKVYPQNPAFNIKQKYLEELKASINPNAINNMRHIGPEALNNKIEEFLGLTTPQEILDVKWHNQKYWKAMQVHYEKLRQQVCDSVQQMTTDDIPKLEKFIGCELPPDKHVDKIELIAGDIGRRFGATAKEGENLALKIMDFDPSFWHGKDDRIWV